MTLGHRHIKLEKFPTLGNDRLVAVVTDCNLACDDIRTQLGAASVLGSDPEWEDRANRALALYEKRASIALGILSAREEKSRRRLALDNLTSLQNKVKNSRDEARSAFLFIAAAKKVCPEKMDEIWAMVERIRGGGSESKQWVSLLG